MALMAVKVALSDKTYKKLQELKTLHNLELDIFENNKSIDLNQLHQTFDTAYNLEQTLKDSSDKIIVKKYKLALLKAFERHLNEQVLHNKAEAQKKKISALQYWGTRALFSVLLFTGLAMDGIASFLGVQEILAFVSAFSSPISLALGIIFCLINSALFYSFEASLLKKALGIESEDNTTITYDIDDEEIEVTKKINQQMKKACSKGVNAADYAAFSGAAHSFNQNIKQKNKNFVTEPSESRYWSAFRHFITGIGAIMQVSSGYFLASSLLAFIVPALIGTPVGWAIIGFGMVSYLAFFLAMRGQAVSHMFNPAKEKFQTVKTKLDNFEAKSGHDFNKDYEKTCKTNAIKSQLEKPLALKAKVTKEDDLPEKVKASYKNEDWTKSSSYSLWSAGQKPWEKNAQGKWAQPEPAAGSTTPAP